MSTATAPQNRTEEILTKNIWRLMVKLSIPAIIAMSVNAINAFVDGLFVGQFIGEDALAALSVAFPLIMITSGLSSMVGVGASSLLSIAIGANDEEIQRKAFGTTTILSVIVSIVWGGLGYYYAYELIAFLGGSGEILEMGVIYFRIMMIGAFFRIFAVAANILIRAEGKVTEAMTFSVVATVINMVLNYLFLAKYGWGIEGVAWATIIAMALFTVFQIIYFVTGQTSYTVDLKRYSLEWKLLRPIFAVGVPAMMLQIMFFVQQAVVFKSLAHYGDTGDLAFMGASYRVIMLLVMPCFGFAHALQPVVGINYGAKNYERVKNAFLVFTYASSAFMMVLFLLLMLYPTSVLGWMLPDVVFTENDIFNYIAFIIIVPLMPLFFTTTTFYQSIGDGKTSGLLLLARELVFYVPAVLIFPLYYAVDGIYYAGIPVNIVVFLIEIWLIRKTFKRFKTLPKANEA